MPGWRAIHTPGHVALFREAARILLPGDAVATVRQESAFSVVTQAGDVEGPPHYFTPDREEALSSIRRLAAFEPEAMAPSHGQPMPGPALCEGLHRLAGSTPARRGGRLRRVA